MAAKKTAVGIDLGTTYSCVGVFQHGKVSGLNNIVLHSIDYHWLDHDGLDVPVRPRLVVVQGLQVVLAYMSACHSTRHAIRTCLASKPCYKIHKNIIVLLV